MILNLKTYIAIEIMKDEFYERRNSGQMIIAVATVVSIIVGSISLITFVQSSERRITTMEVRIESLKDSIENLRSHILVQGKK
jgi:uncharacterized membrane-anchored protein YhcB (DUF1043 family)